MEILQTYAKEIVALASVFVAFLLNRLFRPRAKLIYSVGHSFTFLIDQPWIDGDGKQISPKQTIHTMSLGIRNVGIEPANNLEITLNWEPPCLNVWPPRHFQAKPSAHGRYTLLFESLAPKEFIGVEMLSINAQLPLPTVIRSDQCAATEIQMALQPIQPGWKLAIFGWLMAAGLAGTVYAALLIIQIFVHTANKAY